MILTVDVGNSNIVLGAVEGERIAFEARLRTDATKTSDEYCIDLKMILEVYKVELEQIEGVIIASVVPQVLNSMQTAVKKLTGKNSLVVGPGLKTGLNIKVVGSHGGISVGEDGATHQCIEDFAIMRVIPGMTVLCPCDAHEMRLATEALVNYDGPAYMRLGRLAVETVTDTIPGYKFELGKGIQLREGTDVTIIANGMMVQMALTAAEQLAAEGISARVVDMHTIKPLDGDIIKKAAEETGAIVVTEEHNIIGGLGAAVAEFCSENCPVPVVRHGVNDEFGRSGKAPLALKAFGLSPEVIAEKAKKALAMKK